MRVVVAPWIAYHALTGTGEYANGDLHNVTKGREVFRRASLPYFWKEVKYEGKKS